MPKNVVGASSAIRFISRSGSPWISMVHGNGTDSLLWCSRLPPHMNNLSPIMRKCQAIPKRGTFTEMVNILIEGHSPKWSIFY